MNRSLGEELIRFPFRRFPVYEFRFMYLEPR